MKVELIILLAIIASGIVFYLGMKFQQARDLLKEANEIIKKRRHTYATTAGIEDATAVALDLARQIREAKTEFDAVQQRVEQQLEILAVLREGPTSYDPERPAGRRP